MQDDPHTTVVKTPYGVLAIDRERDAKILASLQKGHYHQEDVLQLLSALLPQGGVFVDVGAHIGTISIPLAERAKVISFEPSARTFEFLKHNATLNNVTIEAHNKGLAAASGVAALAMRASHNAGADTLVVGEGDIPLVALDDEVSHADVIKIDVEGMELSVLYGAKRLIAASRPAVLFEVNLSQLRSHGTSLAQLEKFFLVQGYGLHIPLALYPGLPVLGKVKSLSLVTLCIAPHSLLTGVQSAPFDILALPQEYQNSFRKISFARVIVHLVAVNLRQKATRFMRLIQRHER